MLEPWIIEQIRRREEEERRRHERPQLEIPMGDERWRKGPDDHPDNDSNSQRDDEEDKEPEGGQRGVVIIDM